MTAIRGYRELSDAEVEEINNVKGHAEQVAALVATLKSNPKNDQRWVSIGATELQQGFMALARAIAQPETF